MRKKRKIKIEHWNEKKEKKARFKRKIKRILKRGGRIYGGFINITDNIELSHFLDPVSLPTMKWFDEHFGKPEGED